MSTTTATTATTAPKVGRPPKGAAALSVTIAVRLSPADHRAIAAEAARVGLTLAGLLRSRALASVRGAP